MQDAVTGAPLKSPLLPNGLTGPEAGRGANGEAIGKRRCQATTRAGRPCPNLAMKGRNECWYHCPDLKAERSAAGRRGWAVSNRRSIEAADLVRIKTPKSTDDVCRALADTARAVQGGGLTPAAAREIISALNSISKVRQDEAVLGELRRLSELLESRDGGAAALLAALDVKGEDHGQS